MQRPLCEINLIEVDDQATFVSGLSELLQNSLALSLKVYLLVSGNSLLLSDLLSLDTILQIESAQWGDCYSFIWELPVKVHSALFHGQAWPGFECTRAEQKLYMLIIKFVEQSTAGHFLWRQESSAADMLDLVAGKVQSLCNFPVGKILRLFDCWRGSPKPE